MHTSIFFNWFLTSSDRWRLSTWTGQYLRKVSYFSSTSVCRQLLLLLFEYLYTYCVCTFTPSFFGSTTVVAVCAQHLYCIYSSNHTILIYLCCRRKLNLHLCVRKNARSGGREQAKVDLVFVVNISCQSASDNNDNKHGSPRCLLLGTHRADRFLRPEGVVVQLFFWTSSDACIGHWVVFNE